MILKLKYNEHANRSCHAAFVRGSQPPEWLRVIDGWKVPADQLTCFIIGERNDPMKAVGLFVVFGQQIPSLLHDQAHAYSRVADKLFIPVDADLYPQVTEPELRNLLIWDYQVLHPVYGFTGFEHKDEITLGRLLQFNQPITGRWKPPIDYPAPTPPLQHIQVQALTAEEVFDIVKDQVNSKALGDIPKEKGSTALSKLLDSVSRTLLTGGLGLTGGLINVLSAIPAGAGSGNNGPGLLDKLRAKMKEKLEDLEKKRDTELRRLLNMFDKDIDEALKYAIPLTSPYLNRGEGEASSQLSRRSTNFNLGELGGGQRADFWNTDQYAGSLREQYLRAANKAIGNKDYRKAAYIYAQLLGDYHAAAGVLEKGKFYREAAMLYKDHLKNIPRAAECLERGGLLPEAIELYQQLERHEKSGDLYTQLEQEEQARNCYEQCVDKASVNNDYLEMSRIEADKLKDRNRAKTTLLKGWRNIHKPDDCLSRYFDLTIQDNKEQISTSVQLIYQQETPLNKKINLLHVLAGVNKKYPNEGLQDTSRSIAYEIVSEEAAMGKSASLHLLKSFVENDQLIAGDITRYIGSNKEVATEAVTVQLITSFQLTQQVRWLTATNWRTQLLAVGVSTTGYFLARANWSGHVEYESWNVHPRDNPSCLLIFDAMHSTQVLLLVKSGALQTKWLQANNYFDNTIQVNSPTWLPANLLAIGQIEQTVVTLYTPGNETVLAQWSMNGVRKETVVCSQVLGSAGRLNRIYKIGEHYLTPFMHVLLRIDASGIMDDLAFDSDNEAIDVFVHEVWTHLAIVRTDQGCVVVDLSKDYMEAVSDYFATEIAIVDVKFISGKLFIAGESEIHIYIVDQQQPVLYRTIAYKGSPLQSLAATPTRHHFAVVAVDGTVTTHAIDK